MEWLKHFEKKNKVGRKTLPHNQNVLYWYRDRLMEYNGGRIIFQVNGARTITYPWANYQRQKTLN